MRAPFCSATFSRRAVLIALLSQLSLRPRSTFAYSGERPGCCWSTAGGRAGVRGTTASVLWLSISSLQYVPMHKVDLTVGTVLKTVLYSN